MKKVIVYTIDFCPFCTSAKELLKRNNIPFEEIKLDRSDEAAVNKLREKSNWRTFPQIFFDDELIGGFDELNKLHQSKGLNNILN